MKKPTCHSHSSAKEMSAEQRKQLAIETVRQQKSVAELAKENHVSRKFISKQKEKALSTLELAFEEKEQDEKVLFVLPITKTWLRQAVVALTLHCHSSFRGISKTFDDLFGVSISIGTIHNIVQEAISIATIFNASQDLSKVRHGALDEVFHLDKPVLTGIEVYSLFCYLLSEEDHRDAETWAIRLWDLEKQGFSPKYTIADFGSGLRDGQAEALPGVPCNGDVFHLIQPLRELRRYLANCLKSRKTYLDEMEKKMKKAKEKGNGRHFSAKLQFARKEEAKFRNLSETVSTLVSWMEHDILTLAGDEPETRRELYDFVVDEMRHLEAIHPHRISTVRKLLENQRDTVLAFVDVLHNKFEVLSRKHGISLETLWDICKLQRFSQRRPKYYEKISPLRSLLKGRFYAVEKDVLAAMSETPKASSAVENLHSRLSLYFFLRREIGHKYLELLRFYLNHTPFLRSAKPERVGKTPAELLTGQPHPNWLEMLGFQRFQAAA